MSNEDLFVQDDVARPVMAASEADPWLVLVVDDEPEVHAVTRLVLTRLRYRGAR